MTLPQVNSDYSGGGSGGPNAVKRITKIDGSQATFSYDANGNRLGGDGRTLTYNAFNKPLTIAAGNALVQFHYGADQQRYRQSKTVDGHSETSVYIGRAFEQVTRGARRESRHYLGDFAVLTITAIGEAREYDIAYLHRDRLGGMTATVNSAGQVTGTYGYAPFGQPRDGQLVAQAGLDSRQTTRGFTGHEHLDAVALIHMNGRVYDYRLGQFLSVDPIIHDPADSQSLNPYAYLMNSPLAGTDPTGYDIERRRPGFMEDEEEDPHAELVAQLRTLVRGKHNGAEADPGRQATVFAATDELLSGRVDELARASEGERYGVGGTNVNSGGIGNGFLRYLERNMFGGIADNGVNDVVAGAVSGAVREIPRILEANMFGGITDSRYDIVAMVVAGVAIEVAVARFTSRFLYGRPVTQGLEGLNGASSRIVPGGGLAVHEAAGGHLIARHVGQSEAQLLSRLSSNSRITGASSFTNRATAEYAVSAALDANQVAIRGFLSGGSNRLVINHSLSSPVGISVSRGATSAAPASNVRVVLQRDASLSTGYRIVTGFPTP